MGFSLSNKSLKNLEGVNKSLVLVVKKAIKITSIDFAVIEGLRTLKRQKELFASGASMTMNSKHLTGHAVDLAAMINGKIRWDWPLYYKIAKAMKDAAGEENIDIIWGGDWKKFKDGPHFELKNI